MVRPEVTTPSSSCIAGVLVGGGSRRMGQPKALMPHPDGRTFGEHVVGVARGVAAEVVILGALDALPSALSAVPVLDDAVPPAGPLSGLCPLLAYAQDRWALLLACDMPFLGSSILRRLLSRAGEQCDAVAYARDDRPGTFHTCCALYHPRVLPAARQELT